MAAQIVLVKDDKGGVSWMHSEGDKYLVTGKDRAGRRVSMTFGTWPHARGINLWQGNKWLVRDGKRHLICRVTN